ncbi:glutathione S-transferase F13-like [Magnolia sinica]|uniref:glutathione S-transferase F13-like n=1 Tax=Magnolia sinica TaxID=86752 RepID=UPI002658ECCF|nr:glutathione S-transferase F13-like [Magnolia sinica]
MVLRLYGNAKTTCTARVLSCLHEKDVEFDLVPIDLFAGEHKQPQYLSTKNPFGQTPALEDGNLTLFESRAITKYVAAQYKDRGTDLLRVGSIEESALVNVWLEVEAQHFNPPITAIISQIVIAPLYGETPNDQVVEENAEKLGKVMDIYEERLSKNKYLAGDFYSLADLHHLLFSYYLMKTPKAYLFDSRPCVKAWWDNISSRPAFKKSLRA